MFVDYTVGSQGGFTTSEINNLNEAAASTKNS